MPREGAIIFRDSAKKLDVLRGERGKCGHVGQYRELPGRAIAAGTAPRTWPLCVLRARACQNQKLEEIQQAATATTCSNYSTLNER